MEISMSKKVNFIVDKKSKGWLSDKLEVTTKTVENWMADNEWNPKFANKHFVNRWYNQLKAKEEK